MKLTPAKLYAVFGIVFITAGYIFDFAYVTTSDNFAGSLRTVSAHEAWVRYSFELIKFYLFAQGFLSISFGLLAKTILKPGKLDWPIFVLITCGSFLLVTGGLWEAAVGPVFKMEPPCYVLGTGLFMVMSGLIAATLLLVRQFSRD